MGHTSRDVLAHNATLLAVTVLTFLQCCVKLHHLHGNKRPRARRACPGREAVQRQTAGENRAEQPGRATDTTNIQPNNNGLIDGADKRLAQSTQHTCAHLSARTHTRDTHTKHLPHTSLSTRLLLPLSPHFFFFFFFVFHLDGYVAVCVATYLLKKLCLLIRLSV